MSINTIEINASPSAVYRVLSDAYCYPRWVVGARRVRRVDGNFPEAGSRFHHAVGVWPIELKDHTGKTVKLRDLRGKKVVLWFYPKADTPG